MAYGRKTGGKNFEPGNKLGKGRPRLDDQFKEIKNLDKDIFKKTIAKYLSIDVEELESSLRSIKEKKVKVFDAYIITLIAKGMQTQDVSIMEWLATRSVGKVKDEVDHTITNNVHMDIINYIKSQQAKLKE